MKTLKDVKAGELFIFVDDIGTFPVTGVPVYEMTKNDGKKFGFTKKNSCTFVGCTLNETLSSSEVVVLAL